MIFFAFNVFGILHHYILFDQTVINKAILSSEKDFAKTEHSNEVAEAAQSLENLGIHAEEFTYFEIMKFKFLPCCTKKDNRAKQFKQVNKILGERMDVSNVVNNCGNITLLSNVLMEPYQMKIISHFKRGAEDETKTARKIPIAEALNQLFLNLKEKQGDQIQRDVDLFLLNLIEEDKDKFEKIKEKYGLNPSGSESGNSEAQNFREIGEFEVMESRLSSEERTPPEIQKE